MTASERIWAWVYNLPYNKHHGTHRWTPFKPFFNPWVIHNWPGWKFWKGRTVEHYQEATEYLRADLVPDPAQIRAEALREAHDAIADYPRVSPDADEARHYDEQIEHAQRIVLALIDKENEQ